MTSTYMTGQAFILFYISLFFIFFSEIWCPRFSDFPLILSFFAALSFTRELRPGLVCALGVVWSLLSYLERIIVPNTVARSSYFPNRIEKSLIHRFLSHMR